MVRGYVVDAFTDEIFKGNPAAALFLNQFPDDQLMQNIALENKLSETAFAVKQDNTHYDLRWFTPGGKIDLCDHATLATGFLVFKFESPDRDRVTFTTKSGALTVTKKGDLYEMDFPSYDLTQIPVTAQMTAAFGTHPESAFLGRDLFCVFPDGTNIETLNLDMNKIAQLDGLVQNITVAGDRYDCVSRSFGPKVAIPEDPVRGSGHCHIVPYWAKRLGKNRLVAYQATARSGVLYCEYQGARTLLSGKAALYSVSELNLSI